MAVTSTYSVSQKPTSFANTPNQSTSTTSVLLKKTTTAAATTAFANTSTKQH